MEIAFAFLLRFQLEKQYLQEEEFLNIWNPERFFIQ